MPARIAQSCELTHFILLLLFLPSQGASLCPPGFFLRGLYRGANHNIGNIEWSKCCKPSHHPYEYNGCYNEDVSNTFNKAGLSECKQPGHFIVGFRTTSGDHKLSNIVQFKCCKMAQGTLLFFDYIVLYYLCDDYVMPLSLLKCS